MKYQILHQNPLYAKLYRMKTLKEVLAEHYPPELRKKMSASTKAYQASLTAEQRSANGKKAVEARWGKRDLPKDEKVV